MVSFHVDSFVFDVLSYYYEIFLYNTSLFCQMHFEVTSFCSIQETWPEDRTDGGLSVISHVGLGHLNSRLWS